MKHWTEFRTAFFVAETGSISAASKALGVHRATVLRHLDVVEQELGTKVFLRDSQGYQLTETGEDLLRVARLTEEQLQEFSRRAQGHGGEITGEFILTSLDAVSPLLMPAVHQFRKLYPKVRTRWLAGTELVRLEYGQAHLAIRSGPRPQVDDYVVQPFGSLQIGLFASEAYLAEYGTPLSEKNLKTHCFIAMDEAPQRLDVQQWFNRHVSPDQVVCTSNSREILLNALAQGMGIGFCLLHEAAQLPDVKRVLPDTGWEITNWILTHGDLHRSDKVQAFLNVLKSDAYRQQAQALLC